MNDQKNPKPLAISVKQFCNEVGIGRTLAFKLLRTGHIARTKAGRRTLISMTAVETFLAERSVSEGVA